MKNKILFTILGIVVISIVIIILNRSMVVKGSDAIVVDNEIQAEINVSNDKMPTWIDGLLSRKSLMLIDVAFSVIVAGIYSAVLIITNIFNKEEKLTYLYVSLLILLPVIISTTVLALDIRSYIEIVN